MLVLPVQGSHLKSWIIEYFLITVLKVVNGPALFLGRCWRTTDLITDWQAYSVMERMVNTAGLWARESLLEQHNSAVIVGRQP